jgi:hypothetical protein
MTKKAKATSKVAKIAKTKIPLPHPKPRSVQPTVVHRPTSEIVVTQEQSFELAKTVMTATASIFLEHP